MNTCTFDKYIAVTVNAICLPTISNLNRVSTTFLDSCPFDKCCISIHFVLCIVFTYLAGAGMYIYVYIL